MTLSTAATTTTLIYVAEAGDNLIKLFFRGAK